MPLPTSPTILLAAAALSLVLGWVLRFRVRGIWETFFFVSILFAGYLLYSDPITSTAIADGPNFRRVWVNDPLAVSEQWLVLAFSVLSGIAMCSKGRADRSNSSFSLSSTSTYADSLESEVPLRPAVNESSSYSFLLFVTAGLMFVARSNDFLSLGLSLEIAGLAAMALRRVSNPVLRSTPSAAAINEDLEMKDTARDGVDGLASVFFWIGTAILMNGLATAQFEAVRAVLTDAYDPSGDLSAIGTPSKLVLLAAGLIVLGLCARMRFVPFHLGFVGCVQSCSMQSLGVSVLSSQLAASIALTRICGCVFVGLSQPLTVLIMVVTLATFFVCAVTAAKGLSPGDRSIPRLSSCLSLLQSAWMGIGLMIVTIELDHPAVRWGAFPDQVESLGLMIFSQGSGILSCGGVYWILAYLTRSERGVEFLEDLKGLGRYAPVAAFALVTSLISCVGCPWTAGFWGRWLLILAGYNIHIKSTSSALLPHAGLRLIVLSGIIATLLMARIVIRLLREIVLESPLARPIAAGGRGPLIAALIASTMTLLLGVAPQVLITPLRSINAQRAVRPQAPKRGSGKNRSAFRNRSHESILFCHRISNCAGLFVSRQMCESSEGSFSKLNKT